MVNHYLDVENKLKKQIKFSVVKRNYTSTYFSIVFTPIIKIQKLKINPSTGNVKTSHGLSVNINSSEVERFGGAYKIEYLPEGLKIVQRGRVGHYEIVPSYEIPLDEFKSLLEQIIVSGPIK